MSIPINDGSRPSRLELDARAAGERSGPVPDSHRQQLEAARAQLPPLDMVALRARAHRIPDEPLPSPAPTLDLWGWLRRLTPPLVVLAAAAAAVTLAVLPLDPGTRLRGPAEAYLETFVLQDGVGQPWEPGVVLQEGDRVQFAYNAQEQGDTLVLFSIDGEGTLSVFWPASGEKPEAIEPLGTHLLTDSIELDGARGPEVFVAVFGAQSVSQATAPAQAAYDSEGASGLLALDDDPATTVVVVDKE